MTSGELCPTLAERIDELFATFRRRSEPERGNDEVAAQVSVLSERALSSADLAALRAGAECSDARVLTALAQCFGVPAIYLSGAPEQVLAVHRKLVFLRRVRDAGVQRLALRGVVGDESGSALANLADVVDPS